MWMRWKSSAFSMKGETERHLILQQETTKREVIKQKEDTRRGDNYLYRMRWTAIAMSISVIAMSIASYNIASEYITLQQLRTVPTVVNGPCAKCPEITCQTVTK